MQFLDVYLSDVHLLGVHLSDVHFPDVHLPDVHLPGVHLPGVHLISVHFTDVHFTGVHFTGVYFTEVYVMMHVMVCVMTRGGECGVLIFEILMCPTLQLSHSDVGGVGAWGVLQRGGPESFPIFLY